MRELTTILNGAKIAYINGAYAQAPGHRTGRFNTYLVFLEYVIVEYVKGEEPKILKQKEFVICPHFEVMKVYNKHNYQWVNHIMEADFFITNAEEILNDLTDCYVCGFKVTDDVLYPLMNTCAYYNLPRSLPIKGIIDITKIQAQIRSLYSRQKLTLRAIYNDYFKFNWDIALLEMKFDPHIYPRLYRLIFEKQVQRTNTTMRRNVEWYVALSNKNKNRIDPDGLFAFSLRGEPTVQIGKYAGTLMKDVPAEYWDFLERPTLQDDTLRIIREAKQGIYPVASDYKNF